MTDRVAFILSELERMSPWSTSAILLREELERMGFKRKTHDREADPQEASRAAPSQPEEGDTLHR